jgi:hypothetical protein
MADRGISGSLARWLVRPMLSKHPLPWRIEQDWILEVTDANHKIVIKLPDHVSAVELIAFAEDLEADEQKALREFRADPVLAELLGLTDSKET